MGRIVRSVFVVVGAIALVMAYSLALGGLEAAPGERAELVGVAFAMELLCVGFVALLQQPFFPPHPDAAPSGGGGKRLWRAACRVAGVVLLGLGLYAAREGATEALWLFAFGGMLLLEAQRRPRPRLPVRPALRAMAILFGLLQIYPGLACAGIGLTDAQAADRAPMLILGAAILATCFGFIAVNLRGLLRPLPAPESLIEA